MFYSNRSRGCEASTLLAFILAFSLFFTICTGYSGLIPADPANPGKCFYHEQELKLGANKGPGPCMQLTCQVDGSILIEGCGKLRIENCNRGERLNIDKPYPECCKLKYKCKNEDGSSYYITKDVTDDANKTENSA